MEKIFFDKKTFIWKTKLNKKEHKKEILEISQKYIEIGSKKDNFTIIQTSDTGYFDGNFGMKNSLTDILESSINECKKIHTEESMEITNSIKLGTWINIVRSNEPKQYKDYPWEGLKKYHSHVKINESQGKFIPNLSFVYYLQMPNKMIGDDGDLYILGENDLEYHFKPEEDDFIIMPAELPHAPKNAPLSTVDRIVIAGNIRLENIKKQKTLL